MKKLLSLILVISALSAFAQGETYNIVSTDYAIRETTYGSWSEWTPGRTVITITDDKLIIRAKETNTFILLNDSWYDEDVTKEYHYYREILDSRGRQMTYKIRLVYSDYARENFEQGWLTVFFNSGWAISYWFDNVN